MKKEDLTLYSCNFNKFRVGRPGDGGYVIVDIPDLKYDVFLSAGIAADCSFEEDFCNRFNVTCYAFDGTIDSIYSSNKNIHFIKKNIGLENSESESNLSEYIDKYENIFLKIDIEGSEVLWLNSLKEEQLKKFNQMVIEFHFYEPPFYHKLDECSVFQKLKSTHNLLHFHANNCCGVEDYQGTNYPRVFECTYVKKDLVKDVSPNIQNLPTSLDMANLGGLDISINYPPFVNNT